MTLVSSVKASLPNLLQKCNLTHRPHGALDPCTMNHTLQIHLHLEIWFIPSSLSSCKMSFHRQISHRPKLCCSLFHMKHFPLKLHPSSSVALHLDLHLMASSFTSFKVIVITGWPTASAPSSPNGLHMSTLSVHAQTDSSCWMVDHVNKELIGLYIFICYSHECQRLFTSITQHCVWPVPCYTSRPWNNRDLLRPGTKTK